MRDRALKGTFIAAKGAKGRRVPFIDGTQTARGCCRGAEIPAHLIPNPVARERHSRWGVLTITAENIFCKKIELSERNTSNLHFVLIQFILLCSLSYSVIWTYVLFSVCVVSWMLIMLKRWSRSGIYLNLVRNMSPSTIYPTFTVHPPFQNDCWNDFNASSADDGSFILNGGIKLTRVGFCDFVIICRHRFYFHGQICGRQEV